MRNGSASAMNVETSTILLGLVGLVAGIVAGIWMYKARRKMNLPAQSLGLLIAGVLALGVTWYMLFVFLTLTTGRILAPWDQWGGFAPPPSTWQRQLNDFFGQESHQHLVALGAVGISGALFLWGMLKSPNQAMRIRLPLAFAVTTAAFLATSFLAILLVSRLPDLWLPTPRPVVDVGYHRTWPDLLVTLLLLGLLFWGQGRVALAPFWKRTRGPA